MIWILDGAYMARSERGTACSRGLILLITVATDLWPWGKTPLRFPSAFRG